MAEYENRERAFVDNMSSSILGVVYPVIDADMSARIRNAQNTIKMFEAGNVDISTSTTILGEKDPFVTNISVPKVILTDLSGVKIDNVDLEMTMDVGATTSEHEPLNSETEGGGSLSAGWGPVKMEAQMRSKVAVTKDKSRESDYRAKTTMRLNMKAGSPPEAVSRIIDILVETVDTTMNINSSIISARQRNGANSYIDQNGLTIDQAPQPAPEEAG
ncbi:MAG: DUF2589 domain-containing protein [Alphaproteobacteria bacterium]|nr:DUF2589 domain-containing protein [Alphaproteobacteria bacterium]